jgi:hypothetical protein
VKNRIAVFLAVSFLSILLVFSGLTGAQEQKSQLYSVTEIVVKPAMVSKYEEAVKREIELGYPHPFEAYSTDDFHYYLLVPIEDYGGIDTLNKMESDWAARIGEEFQKNMKSVEGTFNYYKNYVIRFLPEYSYSPKKLASKAEEATFIRWEHWYLEFGKEKEFADIIKQWVDLYRSKEIPLGWNAYSVEIGGESPYYIFALSARSAKSAADYYAEDVKAVRKMGTEKVMPLLDKTFALFRKYEIKTGRPRPDLSNMPKK